MLILYAILIALILLILQRPIKRLLAYAGLGLMLYGLWRVAPWLGVAQRAVLGFYGMLVLGVPVSIWLMWRIVVAWHVNQDRRRGHEKVDQDHDRRMP